MDPSDETICFCLIRNCHVEQLIFQGKSSSKCNFNRQSYSSVCQKRSTKHIWAEIIYWTLAQTRRKNLAKDQRTFIEENLGDNDVLKKANSDRNTNIKVRFILTHSIITFHWPFHFLRSCQLPELLVVIPNLHTSVRNWKHSCQ